MPPSPAVFLDRDGTLIEHHHYLSRPDQVALIPGAAAALRALAGAGWALVVITNQSGIGRGYFGEDDLAAVHRRLEELLATEGIRLDGIYHCPHRPEDGCRCRKPAPALVERAVAELGLDLGGSVVVGDNMADVELGRTLGIPVILVRTGYGGGLDFPEGRGPDAVVDDVAGASRVILSR